MLTVKFENISDAAEIYRTLGVEGEPFGSNFVMYDDDAPVALWRMKIALEDEPIGIIERIFFLDSVEEGDRTFFLHAMFFKLIEGAPLRLRIEGFDRGFEKFGFKAVNGNMEVNSKDVDLHYMCSGRKG